MTDFLPSSCGVAVQQSSDPLAAQAALNDRYKPHGMRLLGSETAFDFIHMSAPVPQGSYNILKYGAAVEITPEPFTDFYMLEMPIAAGVDIESAGRNSVRSDCNTALFLPPHVRFASSWRVGCTQLMLKINNAEVLRRWQATTGDPTSKLPRIMPEIDLTRTEGWRVQQMMFLLKDELERSVIAKRNTLATSPLAGATIDAVIAYFHDVHGDQLLDGYTVLPTQLRRCVKYIDANLASHLTIPHLLAQTDISERYLFNLFQQFLGTTPKKYIRSERLTKARSFLLTGQYSVSEAAKAAGFTHLGRFSVQYRRAYGENPRLTKA